MTNNGASIVLEKIASFYNTVEFIQEHSVSVQDACYLATKALKQMDNLEMIRAEIELLKADGLMNMDAALRVIDKYRRETKND